MFPFYKTRATACFIALVIVLPLIVFERKLDFSILQICFSCLPVLTFIFYSSLQTGCIRRKLWRIAFEISAGVIFSILLCVQCAEIYSFHMQNETFNFAFYMTMLDFDLIREQIPFQRQTLVVALSYLLICTILYIIVLALNKKQNNPHFIQKIALILFAAGFIVSLVLPFSPSRNFIKMLYDAYQMKHLSKETLSAVNVATLQKMGITPSAARCDNIYVKSPVSPKNLVLIILESTEKNYTDGSLFPGVTPNLIRLMHQDRTVLFENMYDSAGYTAEALFQIFFGMPTCPVFSTSSGIGAYNKELLKEFPSLPYILHTCGYSFTHIQTSSLGNAIPMLESQGINLRYVSELNLPVKRGLRDHDVFRYASEIFDRRVRQNQPFAISISTIDAHASYGFIDDRTLVYPTPEKIPSKDSRLFQLLSAVYNCDHHLGVFVDKILSSPVGKDTLICITNDHLMMTKSNERLLKKTPRKNIFMILNADKKKRVAEFGCTYDIAPTILDAMHIISNYKFPIGVSLLSKVNKPYDLRKNARKHLVELSSYAIEKSTKKKMSSSRKIFVHFVNDKDLMTNICGLDVPTTTSSLFYMQLGENFSVKEATHLRLLFRDNQKKELLKFFSSSKNCLFLFRGNDLKGRLLCEYLRLSHVMEENEYALIYRSSKGNCCGVISKKIEDLSFTIPAEIDDLNDVLDIKIVKDSSHK